jgi:hypothetical protein
MFTIHIDHFPEELRSATLAALEFAEDAYDQCYEGNFDKFFEHLWNSNRSEGGIRADYFHAMLPFGAEEEPAEIFRRILDVLVRQIQLSVRESESTSLNRRWKYLTEAYECIGHLKRIRHFDHLENRLVKSRESTSRAALARHGSRVKDTKAKVIELLEKNSNGSKWKTVKSALASIAEPLEKFIDNQPKHYKAGNSQSRSLEETMMDIYRWRNRDSDFKNKFNHFIFNKRKTTTKFSTIKKIPFVI